MGLPFLRSLKFSKRRHILKAHINAHDELASALKSAYNRIKQSVASSESHNDTTTLEIEEIKVCEALLIIDNVIEKLVYV